MGGKDSKRGRPRRAVVVVFSGGIDSACTAAMQKAEYDEVYGITFSYGQRADREVTVARSLARRLQLKRHVTVDIGFMKRLYGDTNVLTAGGEGGKKLPGSFDYSIVVPIRNAVFLSIATAWAFSVGATRVAYGAHTGDEHYPDCRPSFAEKLEAALNEGESDGIRSGLRNGIEVWSPYRAGLTKEDLLRQGADALGDMIYRTWSCYASGRLQCGECESCMNRRRAFGRAGIEDKTEYLTVGGNGGGGNGGGGQPLIRQQ